MRAPIFVVCSLVVCCGGRVGVDNGTTADAGQGDDGGIDSTTDGAGWTQCSAPNGVRVCRGPSTCPVDPNDAQCPYGLDDGVSPNPNPGALCVCGNGQTLGYGDACDTPCRDGAICARTYATKDVFFCAPYELGVLFAKNGAADRVRYADMGAWTGASIPAPDTCPPITGITPCGGNCGPCPVGTTCMGRSPLHPYGFCAPPPTGACTRTKPQSCHSGDGCFVFSVEAAAQPVADQYGHCVPMALCTALSQSLPGGGSCIAH